VRVRGPARTREEKRRGKKGTLELDLDGEYSIALRARNEAEMEMVQMY